MNTDTRVQTALLMLRLGIFIVMLFWTLDKFIYPEHAVRVFEHFYFLGGITAFTLRLIGAAELLIVLAFLVGYKKTFSYGFVLLLHGISTLSSFKMYLDPFDNLLFFAAWPMLAACFALFYLRDLDTRFTVDDNRKEKI